MATTIVVGNFKGGVGKTKVSVMLSWELSKYYNKKVLLVDMDPQGNASTLIARSAGVSLAYGLLPAERLNSCSTLVSIFGLI